MSQYEGTDLAYGEADSKPLTDEERRLLARLLSDPFSYPLIFKTWLKSYIEGSDILFPRSSVEGLQDILGASGGKGIFGLLPAGIMFPYAGGAVPTGCLLCDGKSYSRTGTYERLFKAIGLSWGTPPDSTTFRVPDLLRRIPVGAGATGLGLGTSDGRPEGSRHIDHHHGFGQTSQGGGAHSHGGSTSTQPDHSHTVPVSQGTGTHVAMGTSGVNILQGTGGAFIAVTGLSGGLGNAGAHNHSVTTDAHSGHTHFVSGDTSGGFDNNRPAFLCVGYVINY